VTVTIDGCTLVSGSDDGDVRVWDTESRQCLKVLAHTDPVTAVQLVPRHWIDHAVERNASPVSTFSRQPTTASSLDFRAGIPLRLTGYDTGSRKQPSLPSIDTAVSGCGDAQEDVRSERDRLAAEVEQWKSAAGTLYDYTQKATGL
jgi:WD40 repeat protein